MKGLATADDVLPYTPNNDTVYSGALLELVDEPIVLTVPEILDRYWSVEVADCYTENLFYIGTRTTGGKSGHHAFVGPKWKGKLPDGIIEHRVPYNSLMIALRVGVIPNDDADLKKVLGLQQQFALTSLSNWGDPKKFGKADAPKLRRAAELQGRPGTLPDGGRSVGGESSRKGARGCHRASQSSRNCRWTTVRP